MTDRANKYFNATNPIEANSEHMRHFCTISTVLMVNLTIPSQAAAQEDSWIISEAQAVCILEHAIQYKSAGSPVIIIHAASCPDPNPFAGAAIGKSNYGGVSKIKSTSAKGKFHDVITFTAEDFDCLTMDQIRIEDGVAYLPKRKTCGH